MTADTAKVTSDVATERYEEETKEEADRNCNSWSRSTTAVARLGLSSSLNGARARLWIDEETGGGHRVKTIVAV